MYQEAYLKFVNTNYDISKYNQNTQLRGIFKSKQDDFVLLVYPTEEIKIPDKPRPKDPLAPYFHSCVRILPWRIIKLPRKFLYPNDIISHNVVDFIEPYLKF